MSIHIYHQQFFEYKNMMTNYLLDP